MFSKCKVIQFAVSLSHFLCVYVWKDDDFLPSSLVARSLACPSAGTVNIYSFPVLNGRHSGSRLM